MPSRSETAATSRVSRLPTVSTGTSTASPSTAGDSTRMLRASSRSRRSSTLAKSSSLEEKWCSSPALEMSAALAMSAREVPAYPCSPKRTTASLRMRARLSSLPARGRPGPRRLAGAAWGEVGVLTVFMAESWHLPVRELQGRKAFIRIIRSSVTSACPRRDVSDDLVSVFTQLTSSYQRRDLRPHGLLRLLGLLATTPSRQNSELFATSLRFARHSRVGHSCVTLTGFLSPVQIPAVNLPVDDARPTHPADDRHPAARD